jgi:hypothetical protein
MNRGLIDMARIRRPIFRSTRYEELLRTDERLAIKEKNDCTVTALATALDVPYIQAHQAMEAAGRKRGRGASDFIMEQAAKSLGYKAIKVEPRTIINRYPGAHKNLTSMTTHHAARFSKVWKDLPPMYIVVSGHALGFRDGRIHDWTEGRAKRIQRAYRFEPLGSEVKTPIDKPEGLNWHQQRGWRDALSGHTVCPDPNHEEDWNHGYTLAEQAGAALFPRFGTTTKKRG